MSFCASPKGNEFFGNDSTSRITTEPPGVSPTSTTKRPSVPLIDPNEKAQCWKKFQGVCASMFCPFFTTEFDFEVCGKEHFCCKASVRKFTDLPPRPSCGQAPAPPPRLRIANGWTTVAWPWIVSIRRKAGHICGGTIISPTTVISAAHCFSNVTDLSDYSVVTGEFDITKKDAAEKTFSISKLKLHDYDPVTAENDIALLTLDGKVVMDYYRQPACLPVVGDDFRPVADRISEVDVCIVLGWGKGLGTGSNVIAQLQMAALPLFNASKCKSTYDKLKDFTEVVDPRRNMCSLLELTDTCKGDSGGPLLCKRAGRMVLAGIISWGPKQCADASQPAVYTRVTSFMPWVRNLVKDLPSNF